MLKHSQCRWRHFRAKAVKMTFDPEKNKCTVCESIDIHQDFIDCRGVSIWKCAGCSFQFMNPQYTDKHLTEYYSSYTQAEDFGYWNEALKYGHNFYISLIEQAILKDSGRRDTGALLDIGCGNGHLMEAAQKRRWQVTGYDVDSKSNRDIENRLNTKVYDGDFLKIDWAKKFDLVTMHQVLEHLKEPGAYLDSIHKMLTAQGYLFVAVPNIKSLSNSLKYFLEKVGLRSQSRGKYFDSSHHLLYFNHKTLRKLLAKHGFEVIYTRNCHSSRPNQPEFKRWLMRNITDHLSRKSTFLVLAKKM